MKKILALLSSSSKIIIACSLIFFSSVIYLDAQQGEWTWMKGSSTSGASAVYGTQGIESPANTPPALYASTGWVDKLHRFWLFGGYEISGSTHSSLWRFDPATNNWAWMKGPNTTNASGVYGTQGIPDPANYPGARWLGFPKWVDTSGNLWLFGGFGYGASSNGYLADLWKYDINTNEWTFVKGYNNASYAPTYGTLGVPSPTNQPGSRGETTCSWTDSENRLWFYGGVDYNGADHSDLWMYNIATGDWTWMAGSNTTGTPPNYGTKGVFSATNTPGARQVYTNWVDSADHLWLFGGGYPTRYADLWEFDMNLNQWAWISGSNVPNYSGLHGPKCTLTNYSPNSRSENRVEWIDACGSLWLFGGGDAYGNPLYNDLWEFIPSAGKWVWVSGDSIANPVSNYGVKGVSSPTNKPGGRESSAAWLDIDGNLWFFGGSSGSWNTPYNDMWRYVPDTTCFGCSPNAQLPPNAIFVVNDSSACSGECLSFIDQSSNNPTSWQWSFPGGNPSSSTLQNPSNICYNTSGTYDVTLIVTNSAGSDTIVMSSFITVNTAPTANISQSNDTLYSSTGNSYQWYTGGNAINGATDDFYVPSTEDFYSVVITDANGCTAADTIFFSLSPQTSFAASDTTICQKFCMDFFDQSGNNPITWKWSFPGGVPSSSNQQNPTQICYNNPGVYDVTLITTNSFGSDTLILTGYITVYSTPAFPTITVTGDILTSSYASSYQWQFNSADIPGATNQSYTATQTGYYTVVITDENGCVSSTTVFVEVTGIESIEDDFGFFVYPNPSNGNFIVEFSGPNISELVSIEIVNALGQKVFSSKTENISAGWKKEFNLQVAGVYFLDIMTEEFFLKKKILITE